MQALYDELGGPSAGKLYAAALRRGIPVTRRSAADFVAGKTTHQLFARHAKTQGAVPAADLNERWQADHIDLKQLGGGNILAVLDVFSRKLYTEPQEGLTAEETAAAFRRVLGRAGATPDDLTTDAGRSFTGAFEETLRAKRIEHLGKTPNALGPLDRAIAELKKGLFKALAQGQGWRERLQPLTKAYNEGTHTALHGSAPEDVGESKVLQFRLLQDNARKFDTNNRLHAQRTARLGTHFRAPEPRHGTLPRRGFHPTFEGEVREVSHVDRGDVVDTQGRRTPLRSVLPVPASSTSVAVPAAARGEDVANRTRQRAEQERFVPVVRRLLHGGARSSAAVAQALKAAGWVGGRPGAVARWLRLFPEHFRTEGQGAGARIRLV